MPRLRKKTGFLAVALREQPRATARNREPAYGNDRAGLGPISGDFVAGANRRVV